MRVRRGADPDLIVRLPDGRHAALAQSSTADTLPPGADDPSDSSALVPLLDVDGLRQLLALIARIRDPRRVLSADAADVMGGAASPRYAAAHPPPSAEARPRRSVDGRFLLTQ